MQAIPARSVPRVLRERSCDGCGDTFQPATTNLHCPPCQQERTSALRLEAAERRAAGTNKWFCMGCGVELGPQRGRPAKRCPTCRDDHRRTNDRQRNRERTATGRRKAYDERYRAASADQVRESSRRYKQAHPETDLAAIHRRRQRRDHGMTAVDRLLSNAYRRPIRRDPCFYCGGPGQEDDHYFPLAKGGTDHWYNLVRACLPCNRSKRTVCGTAFLLAA